VSLHKAFCFSLRKERLITSQVMSYGEIMAVCSRSTQHTQTQCVAKRQNVSMFNLVVHKVTTGVDRVDVLT